MDAGGGLFGDAAPVLRDAVPALRVFGKNVLEELLDDGLFDRAGLAVDEAAVAVLELEALVDEESDVTAVVDDELRSEAAFVAERLIGAPPVLLEALALPGEDGDAGGGDGGGSVVLRGEDVARGPAHRGAELDQRLDEHRGLNGHVQRAGDADALEGLRRRILGANRHQPGHLLLGDRDLFAAPVGERNVSNFVGQGLFQNCGSSH